MQNKISDTLYKYYRILGRLTIKYSWNPRPASFPFISGDGFRSIANHIYDNFHPSININEIKENDIVFVGDSNIKKFLKNIHPLINNRYVLITHNGDEAVDEEAFKLADNKIIKWYGINVTINNPLIVPIPLGIGNKHYYVTGIPSIFKNIVKKEYKKENKIFYGFITSTNSEEREPALKSVEKNKYAETVVKWLNFPRYMKLLATYKFVLSPPGSSVEGHRNWEAIYANVIPIVKSSVTIDYFEKVEIPLWVIKDWKEVEDIDEELMETKYKEILNNCNKETIYIKYWIDKIRNTKD